MQDTIFALSSGHPPAGVAIIRISGPDVRFGLETLIGSVPAPRSAVLSEIRDISGLLDRGIVLFFPAPNSFTGEDVAELQIHGSRASVMAVLSALGAIEGFRLAEPGEFTRRAFEHGRMDLTSVEGLSDLIRAETDAQRRQALGQADGNLKALYEGWAKRLTHARAMIEADIDFSDEEDVQGSVVDQIWPDLATLSQEISDHIGKARTGEIVRSGYRVALIGAPNAGKSSLLNCLANRDVAIVSDIPGTTRDAIEVRLDIGGQLVVLIDTAGLRETQDAVELEGIRRSNLAAETADLVLALRSSESIETSEGDNLRGTPNTLTVWTKSDLIGSDPRDSGGAEFLISSKTGSGIDTLIAAISDRLMMLDRGVNDLYPTRERHVLLLRQCLSDLSPAIDETLTPLEIRSEHLRSASVSLGRITGMVDVEDLLGVIFLEFCVGK